MEEEKKRFFFKPQCGRSTAFITPLFDGLELAILAGEVPSKLVNKKAVIYVCRFQKRTFYFDPKQDQLFLRNGSKRVLLFENDEFGSRKVRDAIRESIEK